MAERRPFFSVVIPTTRPHYLKYSLASVLAQTFGNFEVVIAFNRDESVPALVDLPDDPRIKVVEAPEFLIMYDNWENGFRHARGQWRMLLGDDDCLIPQALELIARALKETPDAEVMLWRWGGYVTAGWRPDQMEGRAQLPSYSGRIDVRTSEDVARLVYSFDPDRMGEMKQWLPSVMRGVVRAEIVEAIWARTGMFCMPLSPDYGSAAQILALSKSVHFLDFPIVILNHTSDSMSAGMDGQTKTRRVHFWDLVQDPFFHHTVVQNRNETNRPAVCETLMRVREKYAELVAIAPFRLVSFLDWYYAGLLESSKRGTDIAVPLDELNEVVAGLPSGDRQELEGRMAFRRASVNAEAPQQGVISRLRSSVARLAASVTWGTRLSGRLAPRFGLDFSGRNSNARTILDFTTYCGKVIEASRHAHPPSEL